MFSFSTLTACSTNYSHVTESEPLCLSATPPAQKKQCYNKLKLINLGNDGHQYFQGISCQVHQFSSNQEGLHVRNDKKKKAAEKTAIRATQKDNQIKDCLRITGPCTVSNQRCSSSTTCKTYAQFETH